MKTKIQIEYKFRLNYRQYIMIRQFFNLKFCLVIFNYYSLKSLIS